MMVFISATGVFCHYELLGTLRSDDGDGNENGQKAIGLIIVKQQLCTCITLFSTFLTRRCTATTWKCLVSCFLEDVNKQRRNFPSLSRLNCYKALRNSTSGGAAYFWQSKRDGKIAMKIENPEFPFKRRFTCRRRPHILRSLISLRQELQNGTLLLAVNVENLNKKRLEFCYSLDSHSAWLANHMLVLV